MDVARTKARAGGLPAGVIGALALVLAVESFVARHDLDALDVDDWQYHQARRPPARVVRGRDLLCFGDSLVKVGVLPKVVEARSGLRAYNLAVCGGQAPATYHALRRALAAGARPSAVLVDFYPSHLARPPHLNTSHWPHLLGAFEALELGRLSGDPAFLGTLLVRRALPSVRSRQVLRTWVVEAATGALHKVRYESPPLLRHWAKNDGAYVMPSRAVVALGVDDLVRHNYPADWRPDPVNAEYVRRFLALAEGHGVRVYWLIPPVQRAVQEAKERAGFDPRYDAFVGAFRAKFPNLVVIDGRHTGYDPAVFYDRDHLGREGAFAFSQDLGDALKRLRGARPADRRFALPPYRPRAVDDSVETYLVEVNRTTGRR